MLRLPDITLIALTSRDFVGHRDALDTSCMGIQWGGTKIIWDAGIKSIGEWNERVIKDLWKYVDTKFALLFHADGYVINPDSWKDEFLQYDYVGSPWPLPQDDYSYRDEDGNIVRVGNSVSIRSRKLMELAAQRPVEYRYGNNNEDGHICCWNRKWLESKGCTFAPLELALDFGREHYLPEHNGRKTF